jgi:hypothetical protein
MQQYTPHWLQKLGWLDIQYLCGVRELAAVEKAQNTYRDP